VTGDGFEPGGDGPVRLTAARAASGKIRIYRSAIRSSRPFLAESYGSGRTPGSVDSDHHHVVRESIDCCRVFEYLIGEQPLDETYCLSNRAISIPRDYRLNDVCNVASSFIQPLSGRIAFLRPVFVI